METQLVASGAQRGTLEISCNRTDLAMKADEFSDSAWPRTEPKRRRVSIILTSEAEGCGMHQYFEYRLVARPVGKTSFMLLGVFLQVRGRRCGFLHVMIS